MQSPKKTTPTLKCVDLSQHASQMFGKFTTNVVLVDLAARMQTAGGALLSAHQAYEVAKRAVLPTRVNVKYERLVTSRAVVRLKKRAEIADNRKGGPIATHLFPEGTTAITRLRGASQLQALVDLEGRLQLAQPFWPEAAAALAELTQHRQAYEAALNGNSAARQAARYQRVARDTEKRSFLATYEEIAHLARAQFPKDRDMQELFFDTVEPRSSAEEVDDEEDLPEDEEAEASAPA